MADERIKPDPVRSDVVADLVADTMKWLGESDVTPREGLVFAELLLWQLLERTIEQAAALPDPEEMQRQAKLLCSRALIRLTSRVEAWPAKTHERQ